MMKYNVVSSAMVSEMVGISSPGVLDIFVKKIVNENVRKSDVCVSSTGLGLFGPDLRCFQRTKQERNA